MLHTLRLIWRNITLASQAHCSSITEHWFVRLGIVWRCVVLSPHEYLTLSVEEIGTPRCDTIENIKRLKDYNKV